MGVVASEPGSGELQIPETYVEVVVLRSLFDELDAFVGIGDQDVVFVDKL